jgi:hypothetical protein
LVWSTFLAIYSHDALQADFLLKEKQPTTQNLNLPSKFQKTGSIDAASGQNTIGF